MSKKIVLFLSTFNPERAREQSYRCPDGSAVTGAQTNEAPALYLLRAHPDVTEIICVVTAAARETAWERFSGTVRAAAPAVELAAVPYEESQDFSRDALPEITARVRPGDEILLETTGGFRNAVMYLLLVSRVLSYSGVRTAGAVYSNLSARQVEDASELMGLFDLVGGMQELSSFGSVKTLWDYYRTRRRPDPGIAQLLNVMESLHEDIMLCRTARLDYLIERFNAAMDKGCGDPVMRTLLPTFRAKFGKRLSIPGLIKWCVNNDMIQQALTIYKERIPAYIFQKGIFSCKPGTEPPADTPEYRNGYEAVFHEQLLRHWKRLQFGEPLPARELTWDRRYPESQLQDIVRDYLYIRLLRNMINHANDQNVQSDELMEYLTAYNYKNVNSAGMADIKAALKRGLDRLQPPPSRKEKQR